MKHLSCKLESVAGGGFVATASTDALDSDGERVAHGCFEPLPAHVPLLVSHDWKSLPIGRAKPYYNAGRLMVDATFAKTERAEEVRELAREGFLDAVSVGFTDAVREHQKDATWVTRARLRELSVVVFPANEEARLVSVRSMEPRQAMKLAAAKAMVDALELDLATLPKPRLSRRDAKTVADFYAALNDASQFLSDLRRHP